MSIIKDLETKIPLQKTANDSLDLIVESLNNPDPKILSEHGLIKEDIMLEKSLNAYLTFITQS